MSTGYIGNKPITGPDNILGNAMAPTPEIFTVGHSSQPVEAFLDLLARHGVQCLVDVRSHPYSKYATWFNKDQMERAVRAAGLAYLFLGQELGGQPDDPALRDAEGHIRYDLVSRTPAFAAGIERLLSGLAKGLRIALCCGEADPTECHRRRLIGRVLSERGVRVVHILEDGSLKPEEEMARAERRDVHLSLFGPREEPWRSTASASPARRRSSSLDS